jgi:hypothetical protein
MSADKIRALNDAFRQQPLMLGKLMLTSGIAGKGPLFRHNVMRAVREFSAFEKGNDPYAEHDFIAVDVEGEKVFAKIDYYDRKMEYGSEDPADPTKTLRVMTVMLAEEY